MKIMDIQMINDFNNKIYSYYGFNVIYLNEDEMSLNPKFLESIKHIIIKQKCYIIFGLDQDQCKIMIQDISLLVKNAMNAKPQFYHDVQRIYQNFEYTECIPLILVSIAKSFTTVCLAKLPWSTASVCLTCGSTRCKSECNKENI